MKRHCLLALPLLLAGCNGEPLLGYEDSVGVDVVSLALSGDSRSSRVGMDSPPEVQREAISVMRSQLADAEGRRQAAERHLVRLHASRGRFAVTPEQVVRQQSVVQREAERVRHLRAEVKAAELAHRQQMGWVRRDKAV